MPVGQSRSRQGAGSPGALCVGIDVGGTFTDCVLLGRGGLQIDKRLSVPGDPAAAVMAGLSALDPRAAARVIHGTTIATNALLERRGARTAFVTTAGFRDLLALGRGARPLLYALGPQPQASLVPPGCTFELAERLDATAQVLTSPSAAELARVADAVRASQAESVAVCLLFSYLDDRHERALAVALAAGPSHVSLSSAVLPEFREFERAATTVVNAYVTPLAGRYLAALQRTAAPRPFSVMLSHGGLATPAFAADRGAALVLSGPAGGVLGALAVARRAGHARILTFDMGGTSTDVALADDEVPFSGAAELAGVPVHLPAVDIRTIGAGGGSVVWLDEAGALRVGPASAGADPGPASYGRGGTAATLTDAHVVLGRLPATGAGLPGVRLEPAMARAAFAPLAGQLGLTPEAVALAALDVADAAMARALGAAAYARGQDPADFTLVAFGGAGPLHACSLAERLGIRQVLLPAYPGALSALGLATARPVATASRSLLRRGALGQLEPGAVFPELEATALGRLGAVAGPVQVERLADLRYAGQSWELTVPWPGDGDAAAAFHPAHHARYGYHRLDEAVEVVTLRVRASGLPYAELPGPPPLLPGSEVGAVVTVSEGQERSVGIRPRFSLLPGERVQGPMVLCQLDSTLWLAPAWSAEVGRWGDLLLAHSSGEAPVRLDRLAAGGDNRSARP
jgi:N-methylhydantoinase A